jgi:hypothetical protein
MDDILRQNPELMRQFQTAAVNSMAGTNPGFAGFMGGVMNDMPSSGDRKMPQPRETRQMPHETRETRQMPSNKKQPMFADDGINIREKEQSLHEPQKSTRRPDMRGPSDISDILSGLKTKTIEIRNNNAEKSDPNSSMISVDDMKSIQGEANIPKRSRRKSDKNTISLDI